MPADFSRTLALHGVGPLRRVAATTLQVNVGRRCDLACHHCHVEAGPKRREAMSRQTADRVLELLARSPGLATLDLTGGAPELHDVFRPLVVGARAQGRLVIDRCNLTILSLPGQEDTAEFLAAHGVRIVASLPCTAPANVDAQRGRGVFERSIEALQGLNALGYGRGACELDGSKLARSKLELDLVYNPLGPSLPPPQAELEARYREDLRSLFGIEFDRLFTLTNMPIKRFAHALERDGRLAEYLSLLVNHFNPETLSGLMCRDMVSVGFDGALYDCDFNQMLELPLGARARSVFDLESLEGLSGEPIATASHCFGCTAGTGSSCGGSLI